MGRLIQSSLCFVLLLSLVGIATAQDNLPAIGEKDSLIVTGSASTERARFTGPSSAVEIRLEVYNSAGSKVFDSQVQGGNVFDWNLQDGQNQQLADGSYLCVVRVKSFSGETTHKLGSLTVEAGAARLQPVDAGQLTAQQTQSVGGAGEGSSLTIVRDDASMTTTVTAHNGEDGQIVRGQGALSFRLGDFFRGTDQEQMRLTPEGNLGIGITHPLVRLDVDGFIRASRGIMFPDGTIQTTAAFAAGSSQGTTGQPQIGPGSKPIKQVKASSGNRKGQNTVSPETLINDDLTVNGSIFFTTGSPRDLAMLNNTGGVRIYSAPTLTNSPASAAIQFFGTGSAFPGQAYIDSGAHDNAAVVFRTAPTGGTIAERMRITSTGNVGIGITSPGSRLTVAGVIESTTGGVTGPTITSPQFTSRAAGENMTLKALDGNGSGGALTVSAGNAGVANGGAGGNVTLQAGSAVPQGGVGYTNQGPAGVVSITAGTGYNGVGGNVSIKSGSNSNWSLSTPGTASNITIQGGGLLPSGCFEVCNTPDDGATLTVAGAGNGCSNNCSNSYGGDITLTAGNGHNLRGGNITLSPGSGSAGGIVTVGPGILIATAITGQDMFRVFGDIRVGMANSNGCVKGNDGTPIAGTCSSDIRFKRDIMPFPNLLDRLAKLQPVHYYWRSKEYPDKHFGDGLSYGLIAQEVEKVLPELVGEDAQGYKLVNYSKLPLMTIQAIKELKAENDDLKQKNADLEARLAALEQAMQQLIGQQQQTRRTNR